MIPGYKIFYLCQKVLNQTGEIALVHVNNILRNVEQMKTDLLNSAQQNLTLRIAFCDPGVHWFCVPRFMSRIQRLS